MFAPYPIVGDVADYDASGFVVEFPPNMTRAEFAAKLQFLKVCGVSCGVSYGGSNHVSSLALRT